MSNLENGMLVQHASLGLGKVIAIEPKAVHVFFAAGDARYATKLRLPMVLPLLSPSATTNAWLSGLNDFTLDAKSGRYGLETAWLSHADAVPRFLEAYPGGFSDEKYLAAGDKRDRHARWRRAHATYAELLGNGEGERLLAAGDVAGLVERALRVEKHVRPLHGKDADKASLEDALKDLDGARGYFAALFELVAAPAAEQARFDALAAAVAAMAPDSPQESRWSLVTLLAFVARPEVHMLLRPRFTCDAAQRLGLDLAYEAEPNWKTYSALLASAEVLLGKLRPLGARDHVDVDAFMHVVTSKTARPKAKLALVK